MSASINRPNMVPTVLRIAVPLLLIAGLILSSRLEYPLLLRWGILILVGEVALLLMGFTWPEIAEACRLAGGRGISGGVPERSIYFWEAAARNALHLGVLGTLVGFVIHICSITGGPAGFMQALGNALLSTVYGLILAAVLCTPAVRFVWAGGLAHGEETTDPAVSSATGGSGDSWGHAAGHALIVALILWILFSPAPAGPAVPLDWFVHWPAWLVVFGGALALGLITGRALVSGSLVLGFACAGLIASLLGVVQALQGFSQASIPAVSEGITFMISSCFAACVGLLAIGLPLQDRSHNRKGMSLSRIFWYGFPVLTLLLIALATLMVIVPFKIENS